MYKVARVFRERELEIGKGPVQRVGLFSPGANSFVYQAPNERTDTIVDFTPPGTAS